MSISIDASIRVPTKSSESTSRKRTRDEVEIRDIDGRPFTIRHNPSDPLAKPRTFTPITLLSRSQLPLASLDTAQDGSRLFTAYVQILETWAEHEDAANVLIVEDKKEGRLYAVERVQRRKYALCRLARWTKFSSVQACTGLGERDNPEKKRQAVRPLEDGKPWWTVATAIVKPAPVSNAAKEAKLSMLASENCGLGMTPTKAPMENIDESQPEADKPQDSVAPHPTASQDSLEELAKQYLEYLYLSRLPLTYFVKGPMVRARAACSAQPGDLVEFLRGSVLSSSVMDKKYREGVAELVKDLPIPEKPEAKPKSKRKRKFKPKRDKFGFFLDEKDHAEQWWRRYDDPSERVASGETMDAAIKRRSQGLRNRETFLQIVFILEIMALEVAIPPAAAMDSATTKLQNTESQTAETQRTIGEKKRRKKRQTDIYATLENLLDRLSIWHSLESSLPAKTRTDTDNPHDEDAKDDLKNFAAEVIIPFYAARIPEQAYSSSRKLGGPAAPTSVRKSSSIFKKPGEPTARLVPEKNSRKPLTTVPTDSMNRPVNMPPSLHRSATDSHILASLVKREMSETPPLENITLSKKKGLQAHATQRKRVSLLEQASLSRREFDLTAMAKANEAKLRKKAEMDEKLRQVIDTIKKPNRDRAIEESARNVDESFAKAIAPKNKIGASAQQPRKTAIKTNAGIMATPRQVKSTPAPRRRTERSAEQTFRSGANSRVPSSSTRLLAQPSEISASSFAVPQTGHRSRCTGNVQDTPSRGFNKFMPVGLAREPGTLLESPTANRTATIGQMPAKPIAMPSLTETPAGKPLHLRGTYSPLKAQTAVAALSEQTNNNDYGMGLDQGIEGEKSIYDDLGWNNYDDYEELA